MADDIANLNTITSHPSYARTISLEIGKNNENDESQTKSKRRRRPSKKSQEAAYFEELDVLIGSDLSDLSDLSEYYSAEEDLENLKIESGEDENDDDSPTFADGTMEQASSLKVGRSRAPSKKQKRRRRELKNKILGDFDIPFQDVENIDFELEEMMEDVSSCDKVVQKELPSLFEISLNRVKSRNLASDGLLPGPIKTIISKWKQKRLFLQIQYTWLQRILSAHEEESILQTYSAVKDNNDYDTDEGKFVFAYKVRNVWTIQQNIFDPYQHGDKNGSWLNHTINKVITNYHNERWNQSTVYMFNLLAVVCNMIELLLQQLDDRKIKETDSDKIMERKLQIVRFILAKKYPRIVNCLYDDAIPYIYWAHGNNLAGTHFLQLAQKADEKDERRVVLLAEAARFYTLLNDTNLASKLHRQAADIMMSRTTPQQPLHAEIKGQMLILLANLYDQGPMIPVKSRKSLESWKHVVQVVSKKVPEITWLEAIESCLCYHCGVWQEGDISQLEEYLKLADSLIQQGYTSLYQHKSIIEALLGLQIPSLTSYQILRLHVPINEAGNRDYNPWKPILDSHQTVKLLPVMWRTQMQFIHIPSNMNVVNEFDVQGCHVNFCISSHGHLTGDFQMLLPPLKTVELDLYTGQQVFYPNSCLTNTWHFDDFDPVRCNNNYYNPTLTEIYNFEGNTVHMLMVSTLAGPDVVFHSEGLNNLYWTDANGDKARLNLFKFIKDSWKETVLGEIEAEREKNPRAGKGSRGSVTWIEEMKAALEHSYKLGAEFNMSNLDTTRKNMKKLKKEKEKMKKVVEKKKIIKFPNKIVKYLRYGHTLYLLVKTSNLSNCLAIFIDCSSKESFLKPMTQLRYKGLSDYSLVNNYLPQAVNQVVPRTDTIWWFCQNDKGISTLITVKQGGEYVYKKETAYINDKQCLPLVLNNRFYRVNPFTKKITVQSFEGEDEEGYSEEEHEFDKLTDAFIVGNLLLIKLEDKLIFVDPVTFEKLSIEVSAQNCSLPVKNGDNEISKHYEAIDVINDNNNNGITEIVLAIDYHLLLLHIDESSKSNISIVLCIEVPGHPTEFKKISQQAGFLVSVTQHHQVEEEYKEHIFHYKYNRELVGVLPFLGPGPRDMLTLYLKGDENISKKYESRLGREGWYVYLRDGHGAIMSLYLGHC